jgi:hypothetical protein
MRKQIMAVMLPLLVVTALAAPAVSFGSETKPTFTRATAEAFLASSKGAKSDLCEYEACGKSPSALEWATAYAARDFGGKAYGTYCEGPFENREGHTQWACYGTDSGGFDWQVNVGPYGEETYSRKLG